MSSSTNRPTPSSRAGKATAAKAAADTNRRAQLAAQREADARRRRRILIGSIAGGVVLATILAIVAGVLINNAVKAKRQEQATQTRPAGALAGDKGIQMFPGKAKAGAPVVEVWSDYQCPWCKTFEEGLGDELQRLASNGDIDFRIRQVSFLDPGLRNNSSQRAAEAAACAGLPEVGKYPDTFKAIYSFQPEKEGMGYPEQTLLTDVPAKVGITGPALDAYQACFRDKKMEPFVKAVNDQARVDAPKDEKGEFPGTPAYVVNGKMANFYGPLFNKQTQTWNAAGLLDVIKKTAG